MECVSRHIVLNTMLAQEGLTRMTLKIVGAKEPANNFHASHVSDQSTVTKSHSYKNKGLDSDLLTRWRK